jgi:hypothetical protein
MKQKTDDLDFPGRVVLGMITDFTAATEAHQQMRGQITALARHFGIALPDTFLPAGNCPS